jgi:D-arabinan exo alpha-(1,3)/(1,5)-arabinofuranosidase (non-reducing end)
MRVFSVRKLLVFCAVFLIVAAALPGASAGMMEDLTHQQEGRSMRFSTGLYDPESNADNRAIQGGETLTFCELEGPGVVQRIWITIMGDDRRYPRTLVMRWYWDDSPVPSVEVPVGDFFAAGNGMKTNVHTYPIEVTSFGRSLNSFWQMPFHKKARLEFAHQGYGRLGIYCQVSWVKKKKLPKDTLYFHARYSQESVPPKRFTTYNVADIKGEGQFVGVVLSSQNIFESWFGEADDRYYIDGEKEPSLVGTGTEDWFTDGWNLRTFTNLNAGVSIKERNGEDARMTMYRWHIHEPILFKKSLKVECERRSYIALKDPETGKFKSWDFKYRPDFWSSVAFWYQKGVAEPWCELAPVEERINPEIFIETTNLANLPDKGGLTASEGCSPRMRGNRTCNRKKMMWMENHKLGSWLKVPIKVEDKGRYSISVYQSLKIDRGIWKVSLQGPNAYDVVLDASMDFYDPWLALKENYPENEQYGTWLENKVGIHNLEAGDYTMSFECVGTHPLSFDSRTGAHGYNLALDGISLRKMPIDDLEAWMMDYLQEEEQLFAERIKTTESDVRQLASALEKYNSDKGRYPTSLNVLVKKKYISELKRDPWNQLYQYQTPGRYNPQSFDVFSWHGHSRNPRVWIGNWNMSYKIEGAQEGEDMKPLGGSAGTMSSKQEVKVRSIPPASGGAQRFIRLRGTGSYTDFELPSGVAAGKYKVTLCLVTSWDYGKLQFSLNGKQIGESVDTYSSRIERVVVDMGVHELGSGRPVLRVKAVGKNVASTGRNAGVDAVLLTPVK